MVRFTGNGGRYIGLQIPREVIEPRVVAVDDAVMQPIPHTSEALQLLMRYLDTLEDWPGPSSPALQHAVVTHVHDLVALTIGATRYTTKLAEARGLRAARLESIKKYVVENLYRCELSAASVAAYHRITPRYLRKLFEGEEMSFSHFVLDRRLAHTLHLLKNPRYNGQTITAIAHEAGFNDLSYFNRCSAGATWPHLRAYASDRDEDAALRPHGRSRCDRPCGRRSRQRQARPQAAIPAGSP